MAKASKRSPKKAKAETRQGPFLSAALIAERALTESDNVLTIVRIVDKIVIPPEAANQPKGTRLSFPLWFAVSFKSGGFKGTSEVLLIQVSPSGDTEQVGDSQVQFDGMAATGFNILTPLTLKWEGEGQYWYEILRDNEFVSRIPLNVSLATSPFAKVTG